MPFAPLDQPNQKHVPEPKQAEILAAFSFGIAKSKSRPLYAVARGMAFLGIPDTVETRMRRFISNPRVGMEESCENLARSAIHAPPRKKPVILIVDETGLHDRLEAMVAPRRLRRAGGRSAVAVRSYLPLAIRA